MILTTSHDIKWGQEGIMSRIRILTALPPSIPMPNNTINGKLWKLNKYMTTKDLCFPILRAQFSSAKQRATVVTKGHNLCIVLCILCLYL